MLVGCRTWALALEVFATDQAAIDVEGTQAHRTLFVEVKVKHVLPYLTQVRTADFCLFCSSTLSSFVLNGTTEERAQIKQIICDSSFALFAN